MESLKPFLTGLDNSKEDREIERELDIYAPFKADFPY